MRVDWQPLKRELSLWRSEGLELPLWWRDDDAVQTTQSLDQLIDLAEDLGVPVHLAVVPHGVEQGLAARCAASKSVVALVHGWAHQNHAGKAEKKAEFGRMRPGVTEEAEAGLRGLKALFKKQLLPMFVPPWNRISDDIVQLLPTLGYGALSAYTPRKFADAAPGLRQINTHIDPIDWRGGGGLMTPERIIGGIVENLRDRRAGRADRGEPLGVLTHHLVHDAQIWQFSRTCLATLLDGGAKPLNLLTLKDNLP